MLSTLGLRLSFLALLVASLLLTGSPANAATVSQPTAAKRSDNTRTTHHKVVKKPTRTTRRKVVRKRSCRTSRQRQVRQTSRRRAAKPVRRCTTRKRATSASAKKKKLPAPAPAPAPPPPPATEPAPTAAPTGKAVTRPVGSPSLSDADAAARVSRSTWEPRLPNYTPNHRVPTAAELTAFRGAQSKLDAWNVNPYQQKVTGNFTGTTDEIIQWAAHKWGVDEDIMRAVAVAESWWRQENVTQDGSYQSFGLMQVLNKYAGSHPLSQVSTAFNADFYGAQIRFVYDGLNRWFMDVPHGKVYVAGDIWGSVGSWFAGAWWTAPSIWYIDIVKGHVASQRWTWGDFKY